MHHVGCLSPSPTPTLYIHEYLPWENRTKRASCVRKKKPIVCVKKALYNKKKKLFILPHTQSSSFLIPQKESFPLVCCCQDLWFGCLLILFLLLLILVWFKFWFITRHELIMLSLITSLELEWKMYISTDKRMIDEIHTLSGILSFCTGPKGGGRFILFIKCKVWT